MRNMNNFNLCKFNRDLLEFLEFDDNVEILLFK